ncbi:MAG: hypothetical protein Q9201_004128 [Fulgogasparrea decipioides]
MVPFDKFLTDMVFGKSTRRHLEDKQRWRDAQAQGISRRQYEAMAPFDIPRPATGPAVVILGILCDQASEQFVLSTIIRQDMEDGDPVDMGRAFSMVGAGSTMILTMTRASLMRISSTTPILTTMYLTSTMIWTIQFTVKTAVIATFGIALIIDVMVVAGFAAVATIIIQQRSWPHVDIRACMVGIEVEGCMRIRT